MSEPAKQNEASLACEPTVPQSATVTEPTIPAPLLKERIIETLKTCFDPEIPVNIYELGLIYKVDVKDPGQVSVQMTLTSPHCPVAESLPREVEGKIRALPGVLEAKIDLVWEPPWDK